MRKTDLKFGENNWRVYLRDEADQSVYNEIFKLKEYRSADEAIKTAKYPIVDAGAHAGFFSLYCRALNKKVKIFAVEPEPENLKLLKKHLDENKISGVKIIAGALAGETGERKLLISTDSHNHRLAPVFSPVPDSLCESVRGFAFADFCKQNKIKKISLLKMDIEGGEYELFNGMSDADFTMVNYVILEYHNGYEARGKSDSDLSRANGQYTSQYMGSRHKGIAEKLRANGFGVQVFPSHFDKTMGFIFANNKRAKF